ncbi:hypothetical protein MCOR25_000455 [Pyricularia grisea]|uniref:Uncharacterized protein n=1 Tax=Pyricularia grisea TaxID=148305 RepID=A0A6P8AVV4_PYRGI|nr:uncharacterized protein PgNI_08834 [Pyricularia grisea]KAI6382946.1 hypothetical protein MCOR25_000455 [Pyricularia grisea]TLD06363.1 hypothetical protein PgNI_08834 [Pyricularia grisea]
MCIQRFDQCTKCNLSYNQKTKQCDRNKAQNQGFLAQCLGLHRPCDRVVRTKPVNLEWYCARCRGPITAPMQPHQMMSYRGPTWQDPPPLSSQQRQLLQQQQQQAQKKKGKKPHGDQQRSATTDPIIPLLAAVKQPDSERNLTRSNAIRRHRTTSEASVLQRPDEAWVAREERTKRLRRENRSVASRSRGSEDRSKKQPKGEPPRVKMPLYVPAAGDPTNPNIVWAKHVVESKSKARQQQAASSSSSSSKAGRRDAERPSGSHSDPPAGFTYEKWQTEDPPRRKPSTKAVVPSTSYTSLPRAKKSHPPVTQLKSRPRTASAGATMRSLISPIFRRAASPDWVCADAKLIEKGREN